MPRNIPDQAMAARLRLARQLNELKDERAAAKRHHFTYSTYASHENGNRGFHRKAADYARIYRVDLKWLITGEGSPRPGGILPHEMAQEVRRIIREEFHDKKN